MKLHCVDSKMLTILRVCWAVQGTVMDALQY
jgi:hypothetical protein